MLSIIIAILVFSFLILTHELGHFLFAKRAGIGVIEFSIGMGPRIVSRQIGETLYSLKWIPFGGSCMMVGEDSDDDAENAFNNKSVWARILVVAGGPLFNLISALILSVIIIACVGSNPAQVYSVYSGYGADAAGIQTGDVITSINGHRITMGRDIELLLLSDPLDGGDVTVEYVRDGETYTVTYDSTYTTYRLGISYYADESEAVLSEITAGTPAAEAGLQEGDVITSINGTAIATGEEIQTYFAENPADGSAITLTYERDGVTTETTITPVYYETESLGFEASYLRVKASIPGVIKCAFQEVGYWMRYTLLSLRLLVTGGVSVSEVSGPVGIVSAISTTVESSSSDGLFYVVMNLINMAILLSVNLGVLNLLPIPALDGGRLLFLIIEAIRRKPIPPEKEGMVHTAGFVLLMVFMVFVMFNDIVKIFT
ncbi:MAG: RIP metalloprotease RseP [Lachnospiraceae bacterium]|nr:RIP metalloprotease RseP [Lachnospiraceae bacterium]